MFRSRYTTQAAGLGLLLVFLLGCKKQVPTPSATEVVCSIQTSTGSRTLSVGQAGAALFIYIQAPSQWTLTTLNPEDRGWISADVSAGGAGQTAVSLQIAPNTGAEREALMILASNGKREATLRLTQQSGDGSVGTIPAGEVILGDIALLECPRLAGGANNYFVTHRTEGGSQINYSVEYDVERHNPRWVCFSFDDQSASKKVSRTTPDPWDWDPNIPAQYAIGGADYSGSGFTRGHICASEDRVFSRQANVQTFYYTNVSPQRYAFNTGIWLQVEALVRAWGRSSSLRDVLYVAKGGSIRDDQVEAKRANGRIPVPQYFWMAVLLQKGDQWRAVAFWTEHSQPAPIANLQAITLSVDELERRTGIDFFHNLPDDIEREVESQSPKQYAAYWPGL